MEFLCSNHRRQFEDLPLKERKDLWLFWMETAHACIEQNQWQKVVSIAGSAFDLACLRSSRDESCMSIELTLSAILLLRVLSDIGDLAGRRRIFFRALECLHSRGCRVSSDGQSCLTECVAAIKDSSRQAAFFADYMNWPKSPFGQENPEPMLRTLH